jgi:hypothetical protein
MPERHLLAGVNGTTRKDFRAASNPSALGGRGDELGRAESVDAMLAREAAARTAVSASRA